MTQTTLHKLRSKIVAYFEGKDPRHTHRLTLAARIADHIHHHGAHVPVNVVPVTESGYNILALAVGAKDALEVEKLLTQHKFPDLELFMHSWKRKSKDEFMQRLAGHHMLVTNSRAFKITSMDPDIMRAFAASLQLADAAAYIIDICETSHSYKTGTIYVQYLQAHESTVLTELKDVLSGFPNPQDSSFGSSGVIANETSAEARTIQSQATKTSTVQPQMHQPSKWAHLYSPLGPSIAHKPPPSVPAAIETKPKSFSDALMGDLAEDSDEASTLTPRTNNNSQNSKKSVREIELENENHQLKQMLDDLQTNFESMLEAKLQTMMAEQARTIEQSIMAKLQVQPPASPARKRHNQQTTPTTKQLSRPPNTTSPNSWKSIIDGKHPISSLQNDSQPPSSGPQDGGQAL